MRNRFLILLTALVAVAALVAAIDTGESSRAAAGDQVISAGHGDPCARLARLQKKLDAKIRKDQGENHETFINLRKKIEKLRIKCKESSGTAASALPQGELLLVDVDDDLEPGSNFINVTGTYDPDTDTVEATGTGTVAGFPNVTVTLTLTFHEDGSVTGLYVMGADGELPGGFPANYDITGEWLDPTPTPGPEPTESPVTTPTETPIATPTDAPGDDATHADPDCNGTIAARDSQALLRNILAQNPLSQTEPCPDVGSTVGVTVPSGGQQLTWGDVDCNGSISARDGQALLRKILAQPALSQTEPCPDIGSPILIGGGG